MYKPEDLKKLDREVMQTLFRTMFKGWDLRESSWDPNKSPNWNGDQYTRTPEECMTEAAGGDEHLGYILHLFSHWSNDIISMAAYYGVGIKSREGEFTGFEVVDVPPAPGENYWWDDSGHTWKEVTNEHA